jgi:transcriptional regulator with XRE-family HTH domain
VSENARKTKDLGRLSEAVRRAYNGRSAGSAVMGQASLAESDTNVGSYIKRARQSRGMRLQDLAKLAGCSESMISKLEHNKINGSIRVLTRVCAALNITIGELFTWAQRGDVVVARAADRQEKRFAEKNGPAIFMQFLGPARLTLEGFLHVIEPGWASEVMQHEGEELGYVLEGEIELTLGEKHYKIATGDSFSFQSDTPHLYRNASNANARVLIVNSPPSL